MRENTLKTTWNEGGHTLGLWLSAPDPMAAEMLAASDVDYLNIDMQHGAVDYQTTLSMLQATRSATAISTVRVPWNEPGIIGKVLDAGAMGVIIPMVNTVEQARQAVASCKYAPEGSRSHGPLRAAIALGPEYQPNANDGIAVIPMIETVEAIENLDAILDVSGIDAVYVGPADLSLTLGLKPAADHDDASFNDALATIVAACEARGIVAGIHAAPGLVQKRLAMGFRMITVTSDLLAMKAGVEAGLAQARDASGATESGAMY